MSDRVFLADWPAPANIVAGTTTRHGDDRSAGRTELAQAGAWRRRCAASIDFAARRHEADAVIGGKPVDLCVVRTADCLPVLFCARDGTEIAAAHAGWRGLAAGVIDATVAQCSLPCRPDGLARARNLPAIFEVGGEVREAFVGRIRQRSSLRQERGGRWQADLYRSGERPAATIGVSAVYGERRVHLCRSASVLLLPPGRADRPPAEFRIAIQTEPLKYGSLALFQGEFWSRRVRHERLQCESTN